MNPRARILVATVLAAAVLALGGTCARGLAQPPARIPEKSAAKAPAGDKANVQEHLTRPIAIDVNGTLLPSEVSGIVRNGRVFVPMRELFEALGIELVRSGSRLQARLPTGGVVAEIGSNRLVVDDVPQHLPSPVIEVAGIVYAPLEALVATFGAQVAYDQRGAKIEVISGFIGRNSLAEMRRAGGGSDVQGVVSEVDLNALPPTVTVVRGGEERTISVTSGAKIWSEDVAIHTQQRSTLDAVQVGDAVHAILAKDGRVLAIFDFYKSVGGTIAAVGKDSFVLGSGRVVTPDAQTPITVNGKAATLADLHVGDSALVRSNPESGALREIVVSRPLAAQAPTATPAASPANAAVIASLSLSSSRPLRAGQTLVVTLEGTPGGTATFDIGDYLTGLPMSEGPPGTYVGRFTVPDRFNVADVPVFGNLVVGGTSAPRTQAPLQFSASTLPPSIGNVAPFIGASVDNPRPNVYATFGTPTGIPIDPASIRLIVNGADETAAAVRGDAFVLWRPGTDLEGPVTVEVRVADAAGNEASKTWSFSVTAQ